MMLKTLTAATAAALLALASAAFAQQSGSPSGPGVSGAASASSDIPSKCVPFTGAEREKCVQDHRAAADAGTASGATSPASGMPSRETAPTTPKSPSGTKK